MALPMPADSESTKVANSFYWEESTVTVDGASEDLLLFRKHCEALREAIQNTWIQKQAGEKINSAKFASLILSIKELNRRTQFRIRKARDRTTEQKFNVDKLHLSLQNLLYEVAHLESEIKTCLEFKSQHEKLNLIPVDEFSLATGREPDAPLSHEETLERLYWELDQRKNWSASCHKLMQSVESVSQEIAQKRKYLASFAPKLKELVDNTLVIQKLMDLPFSKEEDQHHLAFLLPTPLYILYAHLKSYLCTMNYPPQTTVEIEGDAELAKAVNQAATVAMAIIPGTGPSPDVDDSDVEDRLEEKKRKTKRRKGEGSSHPPSHASSKAITLHPLRVVLRLVHPCNPKSACGKLPQIQLTLSFAWIAHLGLVTVRMRVRPAEQQSAPIHSSSQSMQSHSADWDGCGDTVPRSISGNELLRSENLLFNLCPTAGGSDVPSSDTPSLPPGLVSVPIQWDACESVGRPYLWAQQLCGLVPLPEQTTVSPTATSDAAVLESGYGSTRFGQLDTWLNALMGRLAGRISLLRELAAIEAGQPLLSPEQQKLIPSVVDVRLANWKRSSWSALENVPRARKLIALKLIQSTDAIFQCEFHRPDHIPVPVWVAVSPEYPNRAPILVVDNTSHASPTRTRSEQLMKWELSDLNLQDLEAEVNCYWTEFFPVTGTTEPPVEDSPSSPVRNILSCQLARCAVCLHALSSGDSASMEPARAVRYPTRSCPLRYLPSLGLFMHR